MSRQKKGIIFCPHFEVNGGDVYIPHVQLRKQQLQSFCLYWDRIVQPVSYSFPKWKGITDEKVLEDAGILTKEYQDTPPSTIAPYFKKPGGYSVKMVGCEGALNNFLKFQSSALKTFALKEPNTTWVPQQSYRKFIASEHDSVDESCIQIKLKNRLPMPTPDISLKKIVAFKYENETLFDELGNMIDNVTMRLNLNNNFSESALNLAISDLDKVLNEITCKSKSRYGKLGKFTGFKLNIAQPNLQTLISEFSKGSIQSYATSGNLLTGFLGGVATAATSVLDFKAIQSKKLKFIPEDQVEISYISEAFDAGIISK